ncbi:MAG: CCA tRNA nucleotidyltransferase [Methanomassiliicoccales archaeon]
MELLKNVLKKISPNERVRTKVKRVSEKLLQTVREEAKALSLDVEVRLVGSVAKDTYVNNPDIDIFVMFNPEVNRAEMEKKGLEIGYRVLKGEERYAEHPYIHGKYLGFEVDIVPCYAVKDASHLISSVDRTPFHTDFIISHLRPDQKDEVRLLKQFMKGIGVYGAEAKVEGFSGYLVELLILYYGSFEKVIQEASAWKEGTILYLHQKGKKRFEAPLVFYDPVDIDRNVASALSLQSFSIFIHACKEFLKQPHERFFFPPKNKKWSKNRIRLEMTKRGTKILAFSLRKPSITDDNLYPQVRKTLEGASKILIAHDFVVLSKCALPLRKKIYFIFELQTDLLPIAEKHIGPPATSDRTDSFLNKWKGKGLAPPYLENGRWMVIKERRYRRAADAIKNELEKASIGSALKRLEGFQVLGHTAALHSLPISALTALLDRRYPWERTP